MHRDCPGAQDGGVRRGREIRERVPVLSKQERRRSAPGTVRIEGGSVGFQIGGFSTDVIMLVMSERGALLILWLTGNIGGGLRLR